MPHLILSVNEPLLPHRLALLEAAHQAMLNHPVTTNADIKSRLLVCADCIVGEHSSDGFVHAEVRLLRKPERTLAVQKELSEQIVQALQAALPSQTVAVQISCDMVEMVAETYGKVRTEP